MRIQYAFVVSLALFTGACAESDSENYEDGMDESFSGNSEAAAFKTLEPLPESEIQTLEVRNPITPLPRADPHVLRVDSEKSGLAYYMVATAGHYDILVQKSFDLVQWKNHSFAFGGNKALAPRQDGFPLAVNGKFFCNIWAPETFESSEGKFILTFSAVQIPKEEACPPWGGGSVYVATAKNPEGPYALDADEPRPVEPPRKKDCAMRPQLAESQKFPKGCGGKSCELVPNLDSSYFFDRRTNRTWLSYSWVDFREGRFSEQIVSAVEMESQNAVQVKCVERNKQPVRIAFARRHDFKEKLKSNSALGDFKLQFDRDSVGNGMQHSVMEGPSIFVRKGMTYALASGSAWDSAYYQVVWMASKWVRGLSENNKDRIMGRFLIPKSESGFGHGSPVLGPDNQTWYYVHHAFEDQGGCRRKVAGACKRMVWITPLEFVDKKDGRGEVHIKERLLDAEADRFVKVRVRK